MARSVLSEACPVLLEPRSWLSMASRDLHWELQFGLPPEAGPGLLEAFCTLARTTIWSLKGWLEAIKQEPILATRRGARKHTKPPNMRSSTDGRTHMDGWTDPLMEVLRSTHKFCSNFCKPKKEYKFENTLALVNNLAIILERTCT